MALMTGSEGLLGVVTEVTVKLLPLPEETRVLLAAFDDVEKAAQAVADIIAAGITPGGLEMMDGLALRAAEDFAQAGYPKSAEAILLCELGRGGRRRGRGVRAGQRPPAGRRAVEVRAARDEAERKRFWAGRKGAFPAVGRIAPDYYCMDGTIPRRALPKVLSEITRLSDACGLQVGHVFHAGDGNLHPLILYDSHKPGDLERPKTWAGPS